MKGQIFESIIGAFVILVAVWFVFSVVTKTENILPTGILTSMFDEPSKGSIAIK